VARCFKIVHHSEVYITSSVTSSCFLKGYRNKFYSYDNSKEPQTSMWSWNRLDTLHYERRRWWWLRIWRSRWNL